MKRVKIIYNNEKSSPKFQLNTLFIIKNDMITFCCSKDPFIQGVARKGNTNTCIFNC